MSNEKNSYKRNNKLTHQQETFCVEVAKGNTQTEAYLIAYPKSKKWQKEAIWVQASILARKDKIQDRIDELKEDTQKDVNWTRKQVLANLDYILWQHKSNILRKEIIYNDMLDEKYKAFEKYINTENADEQEIEKMKNEIRQIELQKNTSPVDIKGILSVIQVINKMQGYDRVKEPEEENNDTIEEYRKQLSIEELKALAYGIMKAKQ